MRFTDEESRDAFHKVDTLTQIICGMIESFAMIHGLEPELIDCAEGYTYLGIEGIKEEAALDICHKINAQFVRKDYESTCTLWEPSMGILEVLVTKADDFIMN